MTPIKSVKHTPFEHIRHEHVPQDINKAHHAEQQDGGLNVRIAVWLTNQTATMRCTYIFAAIGVGSLIGVFTGNVILAATCGALSSYFLQLVFLPVLQTGTKTLSRHQELQADEIYHFSQMAVHDEEQSLRHLDAQDAELLKQTGLLSEIAAQHDAKLDEIVAAIAALGVPVARSRRRRRVVRWAWAVIRYGLGGRWRERRGSGRAGA